jgi:hypothetical protein
VGGRGRGGKKTTPDLALGFALDIKLLDAKGQNTCNIDTAAPWDTMATRAKHSTEFSEFFLDSNSGLVHLVQTKHLPHVSSTPPGPRSAQHNNNNPFSALG